MKESGRFFPYFTCIFESYVEKSMNIEINKDIFILSIFCMFAFI